MKTSTTSSIMAIVLSAAIVADAAFVVTSAAATSKNNAPAFLRKASSVPASVSAVVPQTVLYSKDNKSDKEKEEGELDLNLEEMFDMFDAADKEEKFDDTIKKVKGGNTKDKK
mmetsp:Transcript_9235/g.17380  ORF Transcript_9235/g.17380 Transcript_9235/m.17380 type:complete len:113 (-) Transcript_9235:1686-2024(-)